MNFLNHIGRFAAGRLSIAEEAYLRSLYLLQPIEEDRIKATRSALIAQRIKTGIAPLAGVIYSGVNLAAVANLYLATNVTGEL